MLAPYRELVKHLALGWTAYVMIDIILGLPSFKSNDEIRYRSHKRLLRSAALSITFNNRVGFAVRWISILLHCLSSPLVAETMLNIDDEKPTIQAAENVTPLRQGGLSIV